MLDFNLDIVPYSVALNPHDGICSCAIVCHRGSHIVAAMAGVALDTMLAIAATLTGATGVPTSALLVPHERPRGLKTLI